MFEHSAFAGYPMVDNARALHLIPCRFGDDVTIETTMTEAKRSASTSRITSKKVQRSPSRPSETRVWVGRDPNDTDPLQDQVEADPGRRSWRSFRFHGDAPLPRAPVHDVVQQRDELIAAILADLRDHPAFVRLQHRLELAHQRVAFGRQVQRVGALVARPGGAP